jgi:hypothetical protein
MDQVTHSQVFEDRYISLNEIKKRASSVFTSSLSSRTSDKYKPVSTLDVLEDLATIGWLPIDAYQVTPKREDNIGYQKHFIKLRNKDHYLGTKDNIEIIPELLLINSYDGKCSLKFCATLYRVISNSAIVMKTDLLLDEDGREKLKIAHKGDKSSSLVKIPNGYESMRQSFQQSIPIVIDLMNKMKKVQLDQKQQHFFAKECCRARWDYTYNLLQPKSLLDPWRDEDSENDLLTLSYRIQEKLIRGKWIGAGGRSIKPIKDPNREFNINSKLFQIVENYYLQLTK